MNKQKSSKLSSQFYGGRLAKSLPAIPEHWEREPKRPGMAMSVEEMAEELAVGRNVAYELVQQPGFPSFMIGRRILVSRKGLQDWIDEQCKKGPDAVAPEP